MRRYHWCNFFAAFFSISFVVPLVYMALDRSTPIIISEGRIEPNLLTPGETATLIWKATIVRDCEGSIRRVFTDAAGFVTISEPFPAVYISIFTASKQEFRKELKLPPKMTDGQGKYQIDRTFWCNPVQRYLWPIHDISEPIYFNVVQKK